MNRPTWPRYGIGLALAAAERSEDPYVKVGAVVFRRDWSVAGVGYNGAPPGVTLDWKDRAERRKYVIHAEVNALRYCTSGDVLGGAICVSGIPCPRCIVPIVAHGIQRVYYKYALANYPEADTLAVAKELGVSVTQVI